MKDKFAIIDLGGKQHLVTVGSKITTNRLEVEAGKKLETEKVLLVNDGEATKVGMPLLANASVSLKVLDHTRAKKVTISRFRAKSRYRRKIGHRQPQTTVEVVAITA